MTTLRKSYSIFIYKIDINKGLSRQKNNSDEVVRDEMVTLHRQTKKSKKTHNLINLKVDNCIIQTRKFLKKESALGEYGTAVIRREMEIAGCLPLPSGRPINKVLDRN